MNKWLVKFTLKSGVQIEALHVGPETQSTDVAEKALAGGSTTMNGFYDTTMTRNILVLVGEIAALDISVWKG